MKPQKRSRKPSSKAYDLDKAKKKRKTTDDSQKQNGSRDVVNHAVRQNVVAEHEVSDTVSSANLATETNNGSNTERNAGIFGRSVRDEPTTRDSLQQSARFQGTATQPSPSVPTRDGEEIIYQRTDAQRSSDNYVNSDQRNAVVIPTPGPSDRSTGTFMASNIEQPNLLSIGGNNNVGQLGALQINTAPSYTTSMYDPVGANIPLKIKEKIWAGEYIELSLLLKSAKDLIHDPQYNGDLAVKGGQLAVVQQKPSQIKNIHVWTSAYMIYMGVMLEKWPNKGQEYLKYMYNVRLAAERGSGTGWVAYDEQYRLRKARFPFTSWGDIDMELWLLYVATNVNNDIII